jgi:hypothetical protein
MEERIEPIYLIHYLHGKNINSIAIDNEIYTIDKYSIVIDGEEYATSIEVFIDHDFDHDFDFGKRVRCRIFLYEAMRISIDKDTVTFFIRSSCGIGPDSKIVVTM